MAPKRRAGKASAAPAADAEPEQAAEKVPAKRARKSGGKLPTAAPAPEGAAAAQAAAPAAATASGASFWLLKSEPDVFSIDDLAAKPDQTEHWDGVRSHQAKKVLQSMRVGDRALFYHSNAKPPGVVGIVEIVREAYPDHTQFDRASEYYDPKAAPDKPIWCMVDCRLVRKLERQIPLPELKSHAAAGGALASMALFKYGRLSVQPVTAAEWEFVLGLEGQAPAEAKAAKAEGGAAPGKGKGGGKKQARGGKKDGSE